MHPTLIISAYRQALEDAVTVLRDQIRFIFTFLLIFGCFNPIFLFSTPVDINDRSQLLSIIKSCLGTKFINRWSEQACQIALDAVSTVVVDENGRREIDIKRYAKVEKVIYFIHSSTIDVSSLTSINNFRFLEVPWKILAFYGELC